MELKHDLMEDDGSKFWYNGNKFWCAGSKLNCDGSKMEVNFVSWK